MAITLNRTGVMEEIANFLSSGPSPDEILAFRPSLEIRARAEELLEKLKESHLSAEERRELDQLEYAERLMSLTKARIHARKAQRA